MSRRKSIGGQRSRKDDKGVKVGKSVTKAIDEYEAGDLESSMLHACNAIDGTAKKLHPNRLNKDRFTTLLRDNYHVLGPMGIPHIDLTATRFAVTLRGPTAPGGKPDLADLIYGIHRCSHGHGDELPDGFELMPPGAQWVRMMFVKGSAQLDYRIIFGLLAIAVLSPVNVGQRSSEGYVLTLAEQRFAINEWWGRSGDFAEIVAPYAEMQIKLDFGDWMDGA